MLWVILVCFLFLFCLFVYVDSFVENVFRVVDFVVYLNVKNYCRDLLCLFIVFFVNLFYFFIIFYQCEQFGFKKGYIVINVNCFIIGIVVFFVVFEKVFGFFDIVIVIIFQVIFGVGYFGVSSLDIMDNVVFFISGEEDKIEWEINKIFGGVMFDNKVFDFYVFKQINVFVICICVFVIDGYIGCVFVKFVRLFLFFVVEVENVFREYICDVQYFGVFFVLVQVIVVYDVLDRLQFRFDKNFYNGVCVSVGRIRECFVFDIKFVCLIDNVRLGVVMFLIINVEIVVEKGLIQQF